MCAKHLFRQYTDSNTNTCTHLQIHGFDNENERDLDRLLRPDFQSYRCVPLAVSASVAYVTHSTYS